jgi:hypothetical protein
MDSLQLNNIVREPVITVERLPAVDILTNRGAGAGGANTNLHGKRFEEETNNEGRLLEQGFEKILFQNKKVAKYNYYLQKTSENKTVTFVLQNGLKSYMKEIYKIDDIFRCPDEAYIIDTHDGKCTIKILEKKEQRVEGSVETKLWSAPALKREYEIILGPSFAVEYGFCLSSFLKEKMTSSEKKYLCLNQIFKEQNITVLFGEDETYFDTLDQWIYKV